MKNLLIALVAVFAIFAFASPAFAAPTYCGGEITCSCGDTLNESYRMDDNLLDCPGNGLEIGADNIWLDCNGYKIKPLVLC
jgi:hypothetical protein